MDRDFKEFPDDSTGEALWGKKLSGDDLTKSREIEFTVVFPTENEALSFGESLLLNRQKVLLCDTNEGDEYPFEIVVYVELALSHENITEYQALLEQYASPLNGLNDGWGCIS
ncbi:MAG: hypothetical protein ACI9T9_000830 [Oleiphilaceae bacterium]|jgi:hypothetical protein